MRTRVNFMRRCLRLTIMTKKTNSTVMQNQCLSVWGEFEKMGCNLEKFSAVIVGRLESRDFKLRMKLQYLLSLLCSKPNQPCEYAKCLCDTRQWEKQEVKVVCNPTKILVATDFDGTFGEDVDPKPPSHPTLCISGRTFREYNDDIKETSQDMPVYIRGSGQVGDAVDAAEFKAMMISRLGVTHFLEDDPKQIAIIQKRCPHVIVCKVTK